MTKPPQPITVRAWGIVYAWRNQPDRSYLATEFMIWRSFAGESPSAPLFRKTRSAVRSGIRYSLRKHPNLAAQLKFMRPQRITLTAAAEGPEPKRRTNDESRTSAMDDAELRARSGSARAQTRRNK